MKQRIRVTCIIKKNDDILFLKKRNNRGIEQSVWELPTGKINFGEQPDEAMLRILYEEVGVHASSMKLADVITFTSLDGSSQLGNLYIIFEISVIDTKEISVSERYSAYKFAQREERSGLRLDDASLSVIEILFGHNVSIEDNYRNVASAATVYVDGASRGNPGPSGIGYCIYDENHKILDANGKFIGFATSRVAEYYALKEGCHRAIELGLKNVRFVSDNLMMVNQMNGLYKIKNKDILSIYNDIQILLKEFTSCAFVHVMREKNSEADKQANDAIDGHFDSDMVK